MRELNWYYMAYKDNKPVIFEILNMVKQLQQTTDYEVEVY